MQGTLSKVTSKSLAEIQEELDGWEVEHRRLQALRPLNNHIAELTSEEIPLLEEQIKEKETTHPHLAGLAESVKAFIFLLTAKNSQYLFIRQPRTLNLSLVISSKSIH